jgi:hypothetical protein
MTTLSSDCAVFCHTPNGVCRCRRSGADRRGGRRAGVSGGWWRAWGGSRSTAPTGARRRRLGWCSGMRRSRCRRVGDRADARVGPGPCDRAVHAESGDLVPLRASPLAGARAAAAPVIRFEGLPGEFLQVDWGEAHVAIGAAVVQRGVARSGSSTAAARRGGGHDHGARGLAARAAGDLRGAGRGAVGVRARADGGRAAAVEPDVCPLRHRAGLPPRSVWSARAAAEGERRGRERVPREPRAGRRESRSAAGHARSAGRS